MNNTRFNPTTNGFLHIGHLYMILVNRHEASDGEFILRFDDNQAYWRDKFGDNQTALIANSMIEDLEWMGIKIDRVVSQKEIEHITTFQIEKHMNRIGHPIQNGMYFHDRLPETKDTFLYYPYTPYYTMEKVWLDFQEKITKLIRGVDLITEFSLYEYFADIMQIPKIRHIYLPRLMSEDGESDLSKTAGNMKIRQLRDWGFKPKEIIHDLEEACLNFTDLGLWSIENIKQHPILKKNSAICSAAIRNKENS